MARVSRRPLAEVDILEIWEFIAEDSITEADRWVDKLDERLQLWATQPMMGRNRDDLSSGLRSFSFGRYVIFYEPVLDGVDIVRVLHSSRDVDTAFDIT